MAPSLVLLQRVLDTSGRAAARLYAFIRDDIAGYEYPPFEVTIIALLPELRRARFGSSAPSAKRLSTACAR